MTFVSRNDAIIVGAGVMGAATAYALAKRGKKVVVLEQFAAGHSRGSSHGRSRIFRLSYRDPEFVAMAMGARELWRELESQTGEPLLHITGGFDAGPGIEDNIRALETHGASYAVVDAHDAKRRFPMVALAPGESVLYQPDTGIIEADRAVAALLGAARGAGASVQAGERVEEIDQAGDGVSITLGRLRFEAPVIVVTAGGWANKVLGPLGIQLPVRVTRESVAYFPCPHGTPPPVVEWGTSGHPTIYSLPSPGHGIKAGEHYAGHDTDPDDEGVVDRPSLERVSHWVQRRFPDVDMMQSHSETCIYTNTSDERFIVERHGNVIIGSACSGHGFKFAPLIGERLADLVTR